jgi:HTH-type transcriptional regulator, glycine betaine synthesis regulator
VRGFITPPELREESKDRLEPWEDVCLDAVGTVIEFWGFKRNQGRVWALLYLRGRPLKASEIQEELGLSKGAISTLMRELEQWGVVRRVRLTAHRAWYFEAEQDLMVMIRRVLEGRELALVRQVRHDLERAEQMAVRAGIPKAGRERLARLRQVAVAVDRALAVFMETAQLDAGRALSALLRGARALRPRSRSSASSPS